jgi:hypothetical protein
MVYTQFFYLMFFHNIIEHLRWDLNTQSPFVILFLKTHMLSIKGMFYVNVGVEVGHMFGWFKK